MRSECNILTDSMAYDTATTRQPQTKARNRQEFHHYPGCHNHSTPLLQRLPTDQNNGSPILPSAPWLVKACPICSRSLDSVLAYPRQKSKWTTGNLRANTTQTRMIPLPLTSRQKKHRVLQTAQSSNCSIRQMTTRRNDYRQKARPPPWKKPNLITISYPTMPETRKNCMFSFFCLSHLTHIQMCPPPSKNHTTTICTPPSPSSIIH